MDSDSNGETAMDSGSLSRKITAVAAGEAHTVALTGDGRLYSWGRGMFGRLGTGSESDELFPVPVKFHSSSDEKKSLKFVSVAAGSYHSLALADDGSIWSWGYNISDGQLGVTRENSPLPCMIEPFLELGSPNSSRNASETKSNAPFKVCLVKAGGLMSMAIDNLGALWMWGNCPLPSNTEGSFSLVCSFTPTPVWDFHGHVVMKVACGNEHVIALVTSGETYKGDDLICYSWGNNSHGQLGLGDKEARIHPEIVETFNEHSPWTVYDLACGAFHTALLTQRKKTMLESMCWTFGLGENGQLGHGTTQDILSPEPIKDFPQPIYLVSIDCGLFHTSVVSSPGNVWSWGMEKGLGLCPDASYTGTDTGDALVPRLISCTAKFENPVQIACGAAHTIVVCNDGNSLWSWGRGRSGVLGNGKATDFFVPTIVLWPPLNEDFKQDEVISDDEKDKIENVSTETDNELSMAMEEMKILKSKLSIMERYASILHGSIFGEPFEERNIPESLQMSGTFDIAREWDNMLESAERDKLIRLEMFHRKMVAGVKDKLLKKRIKEIIKECLPSSK